MGETARPARVLKGLTCASCGGTLDVAEGWTNVTCRYCDTPLAVVGERGVVRLMVLDRVDRERAGQVVRQWLTTGFRKAPALKREARVEEAFLAWFPFVRLRVDLVGWVLGKNVRRVKRGNRWVTVEEPVELQVERALERTVPAGEMAEFGVHRVNLAGDELLPLDEELLRKRGMLFRLNRTPEELARALAEQAVEGTASTVGPRRVTFSWLAAVRRRVSVVHYPLWVIRYAFRGRTYQVVVDAEDGTVAYGKAPGNHLYRALSLVGATGAAAFVGTTFLQNLDVVLRGEGSLAAIGIVGAILLLMVRWGYAQFRHGGVVEEGTGLAEPGGGVLAGKGGEELARSMLSALEKLQ